MINYTLSFIFIHIPKNSGRSICKGLNKSSHSLKRSNHNTPDTELFYPHWDKYFTFTFIRNPFDRLVSGYYFILRKEKFQSKFNNQLRQYKNFNDFILHANKKQLLKEKIFQPQSNFFIQEFPYDFVGRYENLQHDYNIVRENLNLSFEELPKRNISKDRNRDYKTYYTKDTRKIVEDIYKEDLEKFNYEY